MKLKKRMMTRLLKGLLIICWFGNGLIAYAAEPAHSNTLPKSSAEWFQSLEEKGTLMLNWFKSHQKQHQLLIEKWLSTTSSLTEDYCMMQYLQAHDRFNRNEFNRALSLLQKVLTDRCSEELVLMAKNTICLTKTSQAQELEMENLADSLPIYQQVLKRDCPTELVSYVQEKFCSILLLLHLEYESAKANPDDFLNATQPYQPMLEHCPTVQILAKKQLLERCVIQYEQALENEKVGQFNQALQLYQQIQQGACQYTQINELAEGKRCLIHFKKIREQTQSIDFQQPVSQLVPLQKACQKFELITEAGFLMFVKMGAISQNQQRFAQAEKIYQQVLLMAKNHFGQQHELVSIILHRLANLYFILAKYEKAQQLWTEQLAIEEKIYGLSPIANTLIKQARIANTLINLAKTDKMLGNTVDAESRLKRALEIYQTYPSEQLNVYGLIDNLAVLYFELGDYASLDSLLKDIIETCENEARSKQHQCALLREPLWASSYMLRDYADAESILIEVHRLKEQLYGSEHSSMGESLIMLALFYSSVDDYAWAESLLKRVLAIREKSYVAGHPDIAEIKSHLATLVYTYIDYEEAESLLTEVLKTYQQVYGSQHTKVADTLEGLAAVYLRQRNYASAKTHYQRAIAIYKAIYTPLHPKVADALVELGHIHKIVGDEAYSQLNPSLNDKAKHALATSVIEHARSAVLFERALTIYKQVYGPQHVKVARTQSYLTLASQKGFADYGAQALPVIINDTERPAYILYTLAHMSGLLDQQNNRSAAIFFGKQAVNLLKKLQNKMPLDKTLQRAFIKDKAAFFKHLIYLLIEQNRLPEALQVIQMFKEEEYFDFVTQEVTRADGDTIQASYTDLEQQWAELASEKRDLERQNETQPSRVAELSSTFLEELKTAFKQAKPEQITNTPTEAQNQLTELQSSLHELGPGAVLVYYLILEEQLMIMLITPDEQIVHQIAISEKEINRQIDDFFELLAEEDEEQEQAQVLYNILIKPIAKHLAKVPAKTLMVSLDGALRYLPIAALHDGQQYLVERYAIVRYTQSAQKTLQRPPKPRQWRVAGLGVSEKVRDEFEALSEADEELEQIVRRDNNDQDGVLPGTIYLNNQFTAQKMQQVLSENYSLLHIASHFELTDTDLSSYLLLGDGTKLQLATIREDYHFNGIDLLTLSACETAIGIQTANGKEIEGFAVLAQNNGAGGVLATLWTVDSASTSQFMPAFYRQLTDQNLTLSKAEALQQVQKAFIQTDEYAHPFYWAPFILMGNWL